MADDEPKKGAIRRKRLTNYSREHLIAYLKDLAARLGRNTITLDDLKQDGEVSETPFKRRFGGLSRALIEAGLKPTKVFNPDRNEMARELAKLMRQLGREPTQKEIREGTNYSEKTYRKHFSSLKKAFDYAEKLLQNESGADPKIPDPSMRLLPPSRKNRRYGTDLDFRGLRHAPINEQGVVFLFGMLSQELGFRVESVQTGFPDCEAKIRLDDGTYERVSIELEYRSSAFPKHGHDSTKCDYIVCWEHDWDDCPDNITVIPLKEEVIRLSKDRG